MIGSLSRISAACLGSVGVYALVCSSLHPHPDAAVLAILMLGGATILCLGSNQ